MSYADSQAILNAQALRFAGAQQTLAGAPVQGIFYKPGKTLTLSDGVPITARVPLLVVAEGDVPVNPVGKTASCEGGNYRVTEALPDGLGLTVLQLERVLP